MILNISTVYSFMFLVLYPLQYQIAFSRMCLNVPRGASWEHSHIVLSVCLHINCCHYCRVLSLVYISSLDKKKKSIKLTSLSNLHYTNFVLGGTYFGAKIFSFNRFFIKIIIFKRAIFLHNKSICKVPKSLHIDLLCKEKLVKT